VSERVKVTANPRGTKRLLSQKTVLAVLFLVVGLEVAALLVYLRLDNIVNGDLYGYGLKFSLAWATDYWMSNVVVIGTLIGSVILTVANLVPFYIYSKDCSASSRWASILSPTIAACFAAVSLYFVFRIDSLVHGTLYQYGLQFSLEWAVGYWSTVRATLGLNGAAIVICVFMVFVTWVVTRDLAEERFQTQTRKNFLARTF